MAKYRIVKDFRPPEGGIQTSLLLAQVKNTAPYIFSWGPELSYIQNLQNFSHRPPSNHQEYFSLCLSAHYATVATYVPTDVDNQIRQKLWRAPPFATRAMAEQVLTSLAWDFKPVTARGVYDAQKENWFSGHHGEWFSMAVGAYSAHQKTDQEISQALLKAIEGEVRREKNIFLSHVKAKDGSAILQSATVIAHNLGDLDRVMDMWELSAQDPLREFYKLGHGTRDPILALAGDTNKTFMALENHRHFALRDPRFLRQNPDFLLPIGPFFDVWGQHMAKHPDLSPFEVLELTRALLDGIDRLQKAGGPQARGYPRALAGLARAFPGGLKGLAQELSAKEKKRLLAGTLHNLLQIPQDRFEEELSKQALDFVRARTP